METKRVLTLTLTRPQATRAEPQPQTQRVCKPTAYRQASRRRRRWFSCQIGQRRT